MNSFIFFVNKSEFLSGLSRILNYPENFDFKLFNLKKSFIFKADFKSTISRFKSLSKVEGTHQFELKLYNFLNQQKEFQILLENKLNSGLKGCIFDNNIILHPKE